MTYNMAVIPRDADMTSNTRRQFLRAGACAAGTLALVAPGRLMLQAVAAGDAKPATPRVALSRFLCGWPNLDERIVARAFTALSATDGAFTAHAEVLWQAITTAAIPDVSAFRASPLYAEVTHRATALALLSAFYLGVVGSGDTAHLVSYEAALMFASTQDVTPIPSYAIEGPGAWGSIDHAASG